MSENSEKIDIVEVIRNRFGTIDAPVTAEQFAQLYAAMAAQQDALFAVFALAAKANPKIMFEDVAINAGKSITRAADVLRDALISLGDAMPERNDDHE